MRRSGARHPNGVFACASPSTPTISRFRQLTAPKQGDSVNSSAWHVGGPMAADPRDNAICWRR
jgi:hypothetical protein